MGGVSEWVGWSGEAREVGGGLVISLRRVVQSAKVERKYCFTVCTRVVLVVVRTGGEREHVVTQRQRQGRRCGYR